MPICQIQLGTIVHASPSSGLDIKRKPALFWQNLTALRDRVETAQLRRAHISTALLAIIFFYLLLTGAQTSRSLWHDELYTYYIAQAPTLTQLWKEIRLDLNPPLIFLAERFSLRFFGDNLYAARIPSIVAFLIGSLCLCKFVADRLRPAYGILAMLVFWATPFEYFATEARPYSLVIGFFGIAVLAWQKAVQPQRSAGSVLLLALAVSGMMWSHVLAPIYIAPFCAAELFRWYRSRRFDWAVWAALVLPLVFVFFNVPLVTRYRKGSFPAVTTASPVKAISFFYRMLEPESLSLFLALCFGLVAGFRRDRVEGNDSRSFSVLEWTFIWSLCLIPVLVTVAMMRSHGVAFPRYSGPAVLLCGILFAFLLGTYTKWSRSAALVSSGVLLLFIVGSNVTPVLTSFRNLRSRGTPRAPSPIVSVRPDLPLVAASGISFLELDKYADPPTIARLYYLTGRDLAIRYAHATIFEGMGYLTTKFPIRAKVQPYQQFVAEHPHFLALGNIDYPEDWLLRRLRDIHASLQYVGDYYGASLYLVTMPGHAAPQM